MGTRASPMNKRDAAAEILKRLRKTYPDAECELVFKDPLQLLVSTILSAQCTDVRVNEVTPALFRKYPDANAFARARLADLEKMIRPTGFFRNKARSILNSCTQLVMQHKGKVPVEMEYLVALAGVGRKTANVVRAYGFGKPGIICDTHVIRLSQRLGLTKNDDPDKIEQDLMKILPEKDWTLFSTALVWHGRRCCTARKPACASCSLSGICPSSGSF